MAAAVLSGAAPIDAEGLDFTAGMSDPGSGPSEEDATSGRAQRLEAMEPTRQVVLSDPAAALMDFVADWPAADREALLRHDIAAPIAEGMAECVRISAEGWLDDSVAFHQPWGFNVASITVPVSIWHGKDDTAAPIAHGRWLTDHVPGCQLHELDGGHYAAYLALPDALHWLTSHA